jgi:hypothetical protein
MLDRRRAIQDCYICGTALPAKGPGWRQKVIAEHVLPECLLGPPPANMADAWAVKLLVHKECERRHKNHRDQLAKILQSLGCQADGQWSQEDIGLMAREFHIGADRSREHNPIFSIAGIDEAMLAPILWTRGMHAAIYEEVLAEEMEFITNSPVPIWSHKDGGAEQGIQNDDARRRRFLNTLNVAIYTQHVDQLRAWGDRVLYQCTWQKGICGRGAWGCTWSLEYPGVHDWAIKVCGKDAPWHGYYEVNSLPRNASVVGQVEIDQWNRYYAASHNIIK